MTKKGKQLGSAGAEPEEKPAFSLISNETLLALYANLVKARMLPHAGEALGYEAATVGVMNDLGPDDTVSCAEASILPCVLHGEKLRKVLQSSRAKAESAAAAEARLHRALGAALDHKTKKDGKVTVAFWLGGEAACWLNALEAARLHSLPIVLVNQTYLVTPRIETRAAKSRDLPPGTELPSITVDGSDVVAVYRVAHEAIDRARRDRGATLIECIPFRLHGSRRRKGHDSIANMESYLRAKGQLQRGLKDELQREFSQELEAAKAKRRSQ